MSEQMDDLLFYLQGGRTTSKAPPSIERGTQKKRNYVDESWLPEGTIPSEFSIINKILNCLKGLLCCARFGLKYLDLVKLFCFLEKSPRKPHTSPRNRQKGKKQETLTTPNVD